MVCRLPVDQPWRAKRQGRVKRPTIMVKFATVKVASAPVLGKDIHNHTWWQDCLDDETLKRCKMHGASTTGNCKLVEYSAKVTSSDCSLPSMALHKCVSGSATMSSEDPSCQGWSTIHFNHICNSSLICSSSRDMMIHAYTSSVMAATSRTYLILRVCIRFMSAKLSLSIVHGHAGLIASVGFPWVRVSARGIGALPTCKAKRKETRDWQTFT